MHRFVRSVSLVVTMLALAAPVSAQTPPTFLFKFGVQGTGDGQFFLPTGIAVDDSGNVYVVDSSFPRVEKFTSEGQFMMSWAGSPGPGNGFASPQDIAIDAQGNVYVCEYTGQRVQKFTRNGVYLTKWGTAGSGNGEFNHPRGIAATSQGQIYVTDEGNNRVQRFDQSGAYLGQFGVLGNAPGQFTSPQHVHVDADGRLYVSDATTNNRVQEFDIFGNFVRILGTGNYGTADGDFRFPEGIATDPGRNIYVSDSGNDRVQKFNVLGDLVTKWGTTGSGDGQFNLPDGIAVTPSGRVYVVDSFHYRVQVFQTSIVDVAPRPSRLAFGAVWPTPAQHALDIHFEMPRAGLVSLDIRDVRGRLVQRALSQAFRPAGPNQWHGDIPAAAGIYFLELRTDVDRATRKVVVVD